MKKISVIVPVYNSEKYLEKTLNALFVQTYSDIEIILVDDGSTDNSYKICEQMAKDNESVSCYRIPNGGPSGARNFGISKATGDYIGFCDSDDIPAPNMYEELVCYMENANSDIALCDIYSERDSRTFGFPWNDGTVFDGNTVVAELMAKMIGNISDNESGVPVWGSAVRCLFKRELIESEGIKFPTDIHFAEDLVFVLRYLSNVKRVVICDKPLYFYTDNRSSIMNSFYSYKKNMLISRLLLVRYIEEIIDKLGAEELKARLTVTERCYYHECVGNACRATDKKRSEIKREIREIVCTDRVRAAFSDFDATDVKTKIKYLLMKYRCVEILYLYYAIRFR